MMFIAAAAFAFATCSCDNGNAGPDIDTDGLVQDATIPGNYIKAVLPDLTSLVKNPCTGWAIYCDGYIPLPEQYFDQMERCGALNYATHLYIRTGWAELEPNEGEYAWENNDKFKRLVQGAKDRGLKLAFRVYYDNTDYTKQISPLYLKDAGAEGFTSNSGFWSPYTDDPVFLSKLEKFIKAMAAEFNDPDIVDFVDGYNVGKWGESFGATYKDPSKKDEVLYKITKMYADAFTDVICVINAHSDIGNSQVQKVLDDYDFVTRHDAYASTVWLAPAQRQLIKDNFPERFTIAESMYWFSQGLDTDIPMQDGFKDWREVMEYTMKDAEEMRANTLDLRNYDEASRLWISLAEDLVRKFMTEGGYRLTPSKVSFPLEFAAGSTVKFYHEWQNWGWGVCPNNNSHWGNKYKVAFALLDPETKAVADIAVDMESEPSEWLMEQSVPYDFETSFTKAGKGQYLLAVGIVDTSKESLAPGLNLAVRDASSISDGWVIINPVNVI